MSYSCLIDVQFHNSQLSIIIEGIIETDTISYMDCFNVTYFFSRNVWSHPWNLQIPLGSRHLHSQGQLLCYPIVFEKLARIPYWSALFFLALLSFHNLEQPSSTSRCPKSCQPYFASSATGVLTNQKVYKRKLINSRHIPGYYVYDIRTWASRRLASTRFFFVAFNSWLSCWKAWSCKSLSWVVLSLQIFTWSFRKFTFRLYLHLSNSKSFIFCSSSSIFLARSKAIIYRTNSYIWALNTYRDTTCCNTRQTLLCTLQHLPIEIWHLSHSHENLWDPFQVFQLALIISWLWKLLHLVQVPALFASWYYLPGPWSSSSTYPGGDLSSQPAPWEF